MAQKCVGDGIDLYKHLNGGTEFEIESTSTDVTLDKDDKDELKKYMQAVKFFTKLECLGIDDEDSSADTIEPFAKLAMEMTNLLSNGKIKKRILREGYGEQPKKSKTVKIHYNAYVEYEGIPFDSTFGRNKPYEFTVGEGSVIEGLELAVVSMLLNEKSEFLIDPQLAYKDSGLNRIQPNSQVLFEIELLEILNTASSDELDTPAEETFTETYQYCQALRVKGKNHFIKNDYASAIQEYQCAVRKLEKVLLRDENDEQKCEELQIQLLTNLLVCYTILEIPKKGCICANEIHKILRNRKKQPAAKVYFNEAKCLRMLGNFKMAQKRLYSAQKLAPNTPDIAQERIELEKAMRKTKEQDLALGRALLN